MTEKLARMDQLCPQPALSDLGAYWMPFTANRQFKADPRLIVAASGVHCRTHDGREVLDAISGLWCCNAGHCHPRIVEAIQQQAATLDYSSSFQLGHPQQFELASTLAAMTPGDLNHVFFTNSGSESVDTALKIALAYHRARGEGQRTRLIGREKGYHGAGFGGISVGGMVNNRRAFGPLLPGVDHLRHTLDLEHNAFSRGLPQWGAHLADDLERLVQLHDATTIAAVIVEPVAGSAGVILPPEGYLQRLREICDRHGILLIFDEVITGFGRLGASFASERFGVLPDLMTLAKGLTSGAVPMGAVMVRDHIHNAFMQGPDHIIEFFHGYTYSGHPLATAAALAAQAVYREEGLFERAAGLAPVLEDALHSLRGLPHVIDIRNLGLVGAVELEPVAGKPTARAMEVFRQCWNEGVLVRTTGDIIALSPPLVMEAAQIAHSVDTLAGVLRRV